MTEDLRRKVYRVAIKLDDIFYEVISLFINFCEEIHERCSNFEQNQV